MDDKDQYNDEEYHFAVEPENSADVSETSQGAESDTVNKSSKFSFNIDSINDYFEKNLVARNSLIAVGVIIVLLIVYQFTASLLSKSKQKKVVKTKPAVVQIQKKLNVAPVSTPVVIPKTVANDVIEKKLNLVEQNQASMKSQFSAINSQASELNTNLNVLVEKINQLSQQVSALSTTVEDQAHIIMTLNQRPKRIVRSKKKSIQHVKPRQYLKYNVQALIPGRAWLVANNGSTLTVRKGTMIPGYGVVKIIDIVQGRVLTSSGQVIKFSQEDS